MDATSIRQYIVETFAEVNIVDASGGSFFFYGDERMFPFATLSISDEYDQESNLSRPGVFRLNVGVSKQTFQSLFGTNPGRAGEAVEGSGHDYTVLDRLMPHPVYGKMYWVCALNPGAETLEPLQKMLAEAYDTAVRKRPKTGSSDET